jgi:hypothetical protein
LVRALGRDVDVVDGDEVEVVACSVAEVVVVDEVDELEIREAGALTLEQGRRDGIS